MDPDATLKHIREVVQEVRSSDKWTESTRLETELAVAVAALDKWLSNGGFLPKAWVKGQ